MKGTVEKISTFPAILAEGPLWDANTKTLYYVDIDGYKVNIIDYPTLKAKQVTIAKKCGCLALTKEGKLIGGCEDGVYEIAEDGCLTRMHAPIEIKGARINDGKIGPNGVYYLGTLGAGAAFYRFDKGGEMVPLFEGVRCSNGLDWTADGKTMYYIDTPTKQLDAFDFCMQTGALSNRRTVFSVPAELKGGPDGATIDSEGFMWIAIWGGWKAIRVNPATGEIVDSVDLPAACVSCCAFAGDDLHDLIITTAAPEQADPAQPDAGAVFRVRVDVPGVLPNRF